MPMRSVPHLGMDAKTFSDRVEAEIVRPLAPATVTLYLRARDHDAVRKKPCGTGTLLRVGSASFLVTARHVVEAIPPNDELVIVNAMRGTTFATPWTMFQYPKNLDYDVAVLVLADEYLDRLDGLRFLGLDQIEIARRPPSEVFSVIGYPQKLAPADHRGQQHLLALNMIIFSGDFARPDFDANHHFLLDNDPALVLDGDGEASRTPDLHGVSGAPVFRLTESGGSLLTESAVRWVGVESGYYAVDGHELVKACGMEIVLSLIATISPE